MSTKTKKKIDTQTLVKRLLILQNKVNEVKPIHEEIDEICMELGKRHKDGQVLLETKTSLYSLQDNFAEKNTAFRVARIKRFEIKSKFKKLGSKKSA